MFIRFTVGIRVFQVLKLFHLVKELSVVDGFESVLLCLLGLSGYI